MAADTGVLWCTPCLMPACGFVHMQGWPAQHYDVEARGRCVPKCILCLARLRCCCSSWSRSCGHIKKPFKDMMS